MKFIKCQNCDRKLLKIGHFDELQVKCPRCKTMNNYQNATSVFSEVHEAQIPNGEPCEHSATQNTTEQTV